jgi:hypothetical protein
VVVVVVLDVVIDVVIEVVIDVVVGLPPAPVSPPPPPPPPVLPTPTLPGAGVQYSESPPVAGPQPMTQSRSPATQAPRASRSVAWRDWRRAGCDVEGMALLLTRRWR